MVIIFFRFIWYKYLVPIQLEKLPCPRCGTKYEKNGFRPVIRRICECGYILPRPPIAIQNNSVTPEYNILEKRLSRIGILGSTAAGKSHLIATMEIGVSDYSYTDSAGNKKLIFIVPDDNCRSEYYKMKEYLNKNEVIPRTIMNLPGDQRVIDLWIVDPDGALLNAPKLLTFRDVSGEVFLHDIPRARKEFRFAANCIGAMILYDFRKFFNDDLPEPVGMHDLYRASGVTLNNIREFPDYFAKDTLLDYIHDPKNFPFAICLTHSDILREAVITDNCNILNLTPHSKVFQHDCIFNPDNNPAVTAFRQALFGELNKIEKDPKFNNLNAWLQLFPHKFFLISATGCNANTRINDEGNASVNKYESVEPLRLFDPILWILNKKRDNEDPLWPPEDEN